MRQSIVFIVFVLTAALFVSCQSQHRKQQKAMSFEKEFHNLGSLMYQKLFQSADTLARKLYVEAKRRKDVPNQMRSQMALLSIAAATKENRDIYMIQQIDSIAAKQSGAERSIWKSIAADRYWQYFQGNRWRIWDRTALAESDDNSDINTWDAPQFFKKITSLHMDALADKALLQRTKLEDYEAVLTKGENTRHLRPTLFDLLVADAIEFFNNTEMGITQPAYQFVLESADEFAPAESFINLPLAHPDSTSLKLYALKTHQERLKFRLSERENISALIDADMHRLKFVHDHSQHPKKDSLYVAALRTLQTRYPSDSAIAEVSYRIVSHAYQQQRSLRDSLNLPILKTELQEIATSFANTEGAQSATRLIAELSSQRMNIQVEEINIPHEPIKALASYQNIDRLFLHLYQMPFRPEINAFPDKETRYKLLSQSPLRSWQQALPGSEDLRHHRTEISIDALPIGHYLLVTSSSAEPTVDEGMIHATPIQVSNLALVGNSEEDIYYVLDRKTGQPIAGATARLWLEPTATSVQEITKVLSDEQGQFCLNLNHQRKRNETPKFTISVVGDTLFVPYNYYYHYGRSNEILSSAGDNIKSRSFLFTDRAIYRPGQTIYFKGILLESLENGQLNRVVANRETEVQFMNTNGQSVTSITLTSNDYGSFEGKFVVPTGGLTGSMYIQTEDGSAHFSVEEYKRPRFQVTFDTLKSTIALNERVTVQGNAEAYAGNNIDGATVSYRVVRTARFPYLWSFRSRGIPRAPAMEISNGTTQTDEKGQFQIEFEAIPDRSLAVESLPIFTYTVYADVTDTNGETRSSSQHIHAGYRSLTMQGQVSEIINASITNNISVHTRSLNGAFAAAEVSLSIAPLAFPGKVYRQRLWDTPDQFAMTESEFRAKFPDDEYQEEANYLNWAEQPSSYQTTFRSTADGQVDIPKTAWGQEGWHVITLKTKDDNGHEIVDKQYTYLTLPDQNNKPQRALFVYSAKDSYVPGEKFELLVKSGFEQVHLLESRTNPDDENARIRPINTLDRISYKIEEKDRGGLAYAWTFVHNNRVYHAQKQIHIPWDNRTLDISWASHRDKLTPGEKETWSFTIKGPQKDRVAAELLAGMYDASLDAFTPHYWNWDRLSTSLTRYPMWSNFQAFTIANGRNWQRTSSLPISPYAKSYDRIKSLALSDVFVYAFGTQRRNSITGSVAVVARSESNEIQEVSLDMAKSASAGAAMPEASVETTAPEPAPTIRTNLQETAFFFPQLNTDAQGNVSFSFTAPEALTEWRLMAFAHTKDWKTGYMEGKVKTQKELMVIPNLPRFLRQGDRVQVVARINNLSEQALSGIAHIEVVDAVTQAVVTEKFVQGATEQPFSAPQSGGGSAGWELYIPEDFSNPVVVNVYARSGNFTDGESHTLPVVSNRILVTETLPLPVRGNRRQDFRFDKLAELKSPTASHHALTVEFTGNPAWYAVQALPYLVEDKRDNADQVFNRYFATALASHIVAQAPRISAIFSQWRTADTAALLSNLQKNAELKSALLEETPWVLQAQGEAAQKQRIAQLFDTQQLVGDSRQNIQKLIELQQPDGGFPWFEGMRSSPYITQYIVTGLARLQQLQVASAHIPEIQQIIDRALPYLDVQLEKDYQRLLDAKADLDKHHLHQLHVQYLYLRSLLPNAPVNESAKTAYQYYQKQAKTHWQHFNPYLKAQIALALHRSAETQTARNILESLRQSATRSEEMGMYWLSMQPGYFWYQAPIEAQAMLIEAFTELGANTNEVDDLKVWLIKQKQTQHWKTTKATAEAIYALLLKGGDWLANEPVVDIRLGDTQISSSSEQTQAGTGYFQKRFDAGQIVRDMGNISVTVAKAENEGVAWGSVYWQYFEDMDKVTSATSPLSVRKQLFIRENSDRGPVLREINDSNPIKVGDQVVVRLVLSSDRDMEYVHLKDMRAAGFEPVNVLSGYRYQGGLGYYENTRDAATHFFFDYFRKGTYVFEYTVNVAQAGEFANGIATVQSMYAPEFSSHSEGERVIVEGR